MRKIETMSDIDKRKKRNTIIMSSMMLFLLILSTLSFAFFSKPNSSDQSQTQDEQSQDNKSPLDKISFQYQGNTFNLISTYQNIENVSLDITITPQVYYGKALYIDSKNKGILQEIASTIGTLSIRVQEACYGKCEENLPEKNCTENIIKWEESSENKVYQQDNCVFIEGDMNAVDAFIYSLLGKS